MGFAPSSRATSSEHPREAARAVLRHEAHAVARLADQLDDSFDQAVDLIHACQGSVIVTGMGKAGLVGQKIAATLASTGTRSHFLHPAEAIHGDLGRVHADDTVLVLSHSGETEEIVRLLPSLRRLGVPIISMTGRSDSHLARQSTVVLSIGKIEEAGRLRLAPTTSTTVMLSLGDALALIASQRAGFGPQDFARFHPGGALGQRLARVEDLMRPLEKCRVAEQSQTVRHILVSLSQPGRRCGAVLLVDGAGRLTGIFTDSDLARLLERQQDDSLDQPVHQVMTNSPTVVAEGTMMDDALKILVQRKISELPVVDSSARPKGLLDITDIVGLLPSEAQARTSRSGSASCATSSFPRILPLPNQSHNAS